MLVRGGGHMTGDQADAKEVRRCLRRNTASTSTAADEEEDTVAGVSVSISIKHITACVTVTIYLFIYLFIYFSEEVNRIQITERHNKPERTQMAKNTTNMMHP